MRQNNINLLNDNAKIRSEAIYNTKQNGTKRTGLKILIPKHMLQRLTIVQDISKSRQQFRKFIKWNQANCLFFVSVETNH